MSIILFGKMHSLINSLSANLLRWAMLVAIFILLPGKVIQAHKDTVDHFIIEALFPSTIIAFTGHSRMHL